LLITCRPEAGYAYAQGTAGVLDFLLRLRDGGRARGCRKACGRRSGCAPEFTRFPAGDGGPACDTVEEVKIHG
jgi:hypothetical protein